MRKIFKIEFLCLYAEPNLNKWTSITNLTSVGQVILYLHKKNLF